MKEKHELDVGTGSSDTLPGLGVGALIHAVYKGELSEIEAILESGIHPNSVTDKQGYLYILYIYYQ
jgi:hypothetical protein